MIKKFIKCSHQRRLLAAVALFVFGAVSMGAEAQQRATAKLNVQVANAEVASLCNPDKTDSARKGRRTVFTCEGKAPTPKAGAARLSIAGGGGGGVRAEITCTYKDVDGQKTWTGCTCAADDDGNCTNFITWCAEQGDDVGGNSGGATCKPGG